MNDRGEGSILGRLAYAAGYAMGRADTLLDAGEEFIADRATSYQEPYPTGHQNDREATPGAGYQAPRQGAAEPASTGSPFSRWFGPQADAQAGYGAEPMDHGPSVAVTLGTLATGWLISRLIRPRPVNWPRAVLAGVAGTALAEIMDSLSQRGTDRPALFPPSVEDLPRYAAGVATAAAYAAQIYPRLPGSPLTRGLIFGTVEATVADSGGALGLLQRVAPQLRLPLGSLATYSIPQRSAAASLAFGLGLGLYSSKGKR
jgi:hypothetical protein